MTLRKRPAGSGFRAANFGPCRIVLIREKMAYKNSGSQFGNQEAYNLISYYQSEIDLRLISSPNYHKEEKQTDLFVSYFGYIKIM